MKPYQRETFKLSAAPCAAKGYPMEVEDGRFLHADGTGFPIAPEFLEGDWGSSAIGWGVGNPLQPAPERFWVRWFSYPEDKFYEGYFLLPQQRLHDLLKQGYWNTREKKQDTYDELTLCLLPKGVVVLWLSGQNQVLIGRYEGREVNFDFKRFNEAANRARMIAQEQAKLPPAVQAQIRTRTLSTKQWDAYLKKYNWKVAFSQPLKLLNYGIYYFNAEKTNYPSSSDFSAYGKVVLEPTAKPVPNSLYMWVDAGYGRKRQIQIREFNETETLAAFQTLYATCPDLPMTLYLETDERASKVRVLLKNDRQQIELAKAKVELYDAK